MLRRLTVLLALLAACSSGGHTASAPSTTRRPTTTTTSTVVASSTTTTTTSLPHLPAGPSGGEVRALRTPTGVIVPVVGRVGTAWRVLSPCGRTTTVRGGTAIYGATVLLDPGHGGIETGATGPNGLVERDLNLAVAERAKADLERDGATVVMTRSADYRVTLDVRGQLAQRLRPMLFVSIHHNGGDDGPSKTPGTETYYQHDSAASRRLAGLLYEDVYKVFAGRPGIEWHANVDAGAKVRLGQKGDDYYGVLRLTHGIPAVISEALFLSAGPTEADLLARPDVQAAEAEAITHAVARYLVTKDPGSGFVNPIVRTTPAGGGGGASGCVDPPLS